MEIWVWGNEAQDDNGENEKHEDDKNDDIMNIMKTMTMMRIMTYKGNMKIAKYRRRRVHYKNEEIKIWWKYKIDDNDDDKYDKHGQHEHDEHD